MKKIINKILAVSFVAITMTSCLKDDSMVTDPDKSVGNVVEFGNTGSPTSAAGAPVFAYTPMTIDPAVAGDAKFTTSIRYAGAEDVAPQDITVEIAAAPEAVAAWNATYSTAQFPYFQLPTNAVTFPTSVTIKKGQKAASFDVVIKPNLLDASKANVMALKITSSTAGIISGNFGKVIYNLPIKSIWDGKYTYTMLNNYGTIDPNIGGTFTEQDVSLRTVGPNLLEVTLLGQTYGGYARYQFSGDNTTITSTVAFSGSLRASNIDQVVLVDPINKKWTLRWTWLGRGTQETWVRTGDN